MLHGNVTLSDPKKEYSPRQRPQAKTRPKHLCLNLELCEEMINEDES